MHENDVNGDEEAYDNENADQDEEGFDGQEQDHFGAVGQHHLAIPEGDD